MSAVGEPLCFGQSVKVRGAVRKLASEPTTRKPDRKFIQSCSGQQQLDNTAGPSGWKMVSVSCARLWESDIFSQELPSAFISKRWSLSSEPPADALVHVTVTSQSKMSAFADKLPLKTVFFGTCRFKSPGNTHKVTASTLIMY